MVSKKSQANGDSTCKLHPVNKQSETLMIGYYGRLLSPTSPFQANGSINALEEYLKDEWGIPDLCFEARSNLWAGAMAFPSISSGGSSSEKREYNCHFAHPEHKLIVVISMLHRPTRQGMGLGMYTCNNL
jgi:hypothetical protein